MTDHNAESPPKETSIHDSDAISREGLSPGPRANAPTSQAKATRTTNRRRVVGFLLLVIMGGVGWGAYVVYIPHVPSQQTADEKKEIAEVQHKAEEPESIESRLIGTWEDDYHGTRTLTLRPDGTGTMVCELEGLEATLFAEKLTFQEQWFVKDGKLTMRVTGGEPEEKINFVLNIEGDTTTQEIRELTDSRLRLFDPKGNKEFNWRAVSKPPTTNGTNHSGDSESTPTANKKKDAD